MDLKDSSVFTLGSELVELYSVKSQIDHLIKSVLNYIWQSDKNDGLCDDFCYSLKESFTRLPSETTSIIWSLINKEFLDHYNNGQETLKFQMISDIMEMFMRNISVADAPQHIALLIGSHFKCTKDFIIHHLKKKCLDEKSFADMFTLLRLLHVCTEFWLSLPEETVIAQSVRSQLNIEKIKGTTEFTDLLILIPEISYKKLRKIHHGIIKTNNKKLLFIWECLLIQNLRWWSHLVVNSERNDYLSLQSKLCDYMILEKLKKTPLSMDVEYNGHLHTVTDDSYNVALWGLICDNLLFLLPFNDAAPSTYESTVAEFMISTLLMTTMYNGKNICLRSTTMKLMSEWNSNGFSALKSVHTSICTTLLSRLTKQRIHQTSSKRFKGNSIVKAQKCIAELVKETLPNDKLLSAAGEILWPFKEIFSLVNDILQQFPAMYDINACNENDDEVLPVLQILRDHLLPYLNTVDIIRCFLSVVALLADEFNISSVFEISLDIMRLLLHEGQGILFLLCGLHAGHLLNFLSSLSDHALKQLNRLDLSENSEEVFKLVLNYTLKDPRSIQNFNTFVDGIVSITKEKRKSLISGETGLLCRTLSNMVTCMESIRKVLHQAYIRPDVESLLLPLNSTLVKEFDQLLSKFYNDNHSSEEINVLADYLMSGYISHLVELKTISETKGKEESTKTKQDKISKTLPNLCKSCIVRLCLSKNSKVNTRCLNFINAICFHHQLIKNHLPENFLVEVWMSLITVLRQSVDKDLSLLEKSSSNENKVSFASTNDQIQVLQKTVAIVTHVFELNEFDRHMDILLSDLNACHVNSDSIRVLTALGIWQQMTEEYLNDDLQSSFYIYCQKLLLSVQELLFNCSQNVLIIVASFETLTKLVSLGSSFFEAQELSLCMQSFADVNLLVINDIDDFVKVFDSLYRLLNALLLYQSDFVHMAIPLYICGVIKLLKSIVCRGHQDKSRPLNDSQLEKLDHCARLIYRLASLICEHKVDFGKVAPYLVSEYVNEVQKVTLYPIVKKSLLLGVYRWLDICNDHSIAQLYTALPPGAKDIFRFLHSEFEKYYRYKGQS